MGGIRRELSPVWFVYSINMGYGIYLNLDSRDLSKRFTCKKNWSNFLCLVCMPLSYVVSLIHTPAASAKLRRMVTGNSWDLNFVLCYKVVHYPFCEFGAVWNSVTIVGWSASGGYRLPRYHFASNHLVVPRYVQSDLLVT